jgi:soluble lytic murein transglycosylase-like protein
MGGAFLSRHRGRATGFVVAAFLSAAFATSALADSSRPDWVRPATTRSASEEAALPRGVFDTLSPEQTQPLPRLLANLDVELYAEIFRLQEDAGWSAADKLIRQVKDRRLLGSVLAQRYTHPKYRASYDELSQWLKAYGDHPDSASLYRLSIQRKPKKASAPARPEKGFLSGFGEEANSPDTIYSSARSRDDAEIRDVINAAGELRLHLRKSNPDMVERAPHKIEAKRILDSVELGIVGAEVAQGYFFAGDDRKALALAATATRQAAGWQPLAPWIAGLAAFRLDRPVEAAGFFETLLESNGLPPGQASAAAFWAARAHLVAGQHDKVSRYLVRAAVNRTSFYGLLARRALGVDTPFNWAEPRLTTEDIRQIQGHASGWRALALIQVGEDTRAEGELRRLAPVLGQDKAPALLALASRANMPALSMRLAGRIAVAENLRYDGALYPIPGWKPEGGFSVDPALLFAIMRQESAFHSKASSGAGASGLMQIMPATAVSVGEGEIKKKNAKEALMEPERNITLGQRYVQRLLEHSEIQGNLLVALAAYNAGPSNALKWQRKGEAKEDPLLFVESIPFAETRAYVQRVISNYWIYQLRMSQPTPTLDAVAAGDWPIYTPEKGG